MAAVLVLLLEKLLLEAAAASQLMRKEEEAPGLVWVHLEPAINQIRRLKFEICAILRQNNNNIN